MWMKRERESAVWGGGKVKEDQISFSFITIIDHHCQRIAPHPAASSSPDALRALPAQQRKPTYLERECLV